MQYLAQTRGGYISSIFLHLQIKFCITYLTIIPNATLLLFAIPPLHHDGVE